MGLFSIFGFGNSKIKDALRRGAVVIDLRPPYRFDEGKVPHSINIPADRIIINLERIRSMKKPVILCSGSDAQNENAANYLRANGVKEVYNGGNWERVLKIVRSL